MTDQGRPGFDKIFNPKSIAVVGVSRKEYLFGLSGTSFVDRLLSCGYPGEIYPINPKMQEVLGLRVYASLEALPEVPELAIVCLAAQRVPGTLETCARIGVQAVHLLTSGFKEIGTAEGAALEARVAEIAEANGLLVVGPNCMGPYSPPSHFTAYGASPGLVGPLGIISQSGGITQRITEYSSSLNLGIHKAVSFGNAAVLDACDYLEDFGRDDSVGIIGMYLEDVRDGRRLLRLAREINTRKPIVMLKGGRSEAGARTAASHTGAMAGARGAWDAFFRQSGVTRVESLSEWMDAMLAFGFLPAPSGDSIFIGTGGGGSSVIAGDLAAAAGLDVPDLSEATSTALRELYPDVGSIVGNPLDGFVTVNADLLCATLDLIDSEPGCDMVLVEHLIPRGIYHLKEDLLPDSIPPIIDYLSATPPSKPTVFCIDYDGGNEELAQKGFEVRRRFCDTGVPTFPSVRRAVRALRHLSRYHAWCQDQGL